MSTDERFDASISGWLEQTAPGRLPDRVLEATFERTRVSRQRVGWRSILGRQGPTRSIVAFGGAASVIAIATVVALSSLDDRPSVGGPSPSSEARSVFDGTWFSTSDADGGTQIMTVHALAGGGVEIVVTDDIASVCSRTPSTMTGTGRVDGGSRLVIPQPVYTCDDGSEAVALSGPPLADQLRNLTYVLDPSTGSLADDFDGIWTRERGAVPSVAPPEAEQLIADGTLGSFAATASGYLLTIWDMCHVFGQTDCGFAWRLGEGSQALATGVVYPGRAVYDSGDVFVPVAAGDGFILAPPSGDEMGLRIAQDGTTASLSMTCVEASWSTPTEPGRLVWTTGLNFVDTVAGTICPTSRLGGRSLARGVFAPDGVLWALVDNEIGPGTLTIGRYDGTQWADHDFAAPSGSWTSVLAATGSTAFVLLANPEPSPQPDRLVGFAVTTDAGATWSEVVDPEVLERDLPFSTVVSANDEDWYSGYTSMAFAGPSTLYVADRNGDLWRSTDLASFSQIAVPGGVRELQTAGDAVIGRTGDGNDLVRIYADGRIEPLTVR